MSDDGATILGMISERDLVRGLSEHGAQLQALPVSKVMTTPVLTCTPGERVTAVMVRLTRHRVRHLPVVDGGRLAGIISIGDVVKYRLDELELEANVLRETLIVSHCASSATDVWRICRDVDRAHCYLLGVRLRMGVALLSPRGATIAEASMKIREPR